MSGSLETFTRLNRCSESDAWAIMYVALILPPTVDRSTSRQELVTTTAKAAYNND